MAFFEGLHRAPGDPELYRWADWAELLAFTSASGRLSIEDFAESIERRRDYLAVEGNDDRDPSKANQKDDLVDSIPDAVMFKDATVDKAVTVFYLLEARSKAYMSAYPFTFESNVLEVRKSDTNATAIYLFLLACASFRYVASKRAQTQLATDFERLSLEIMRTLLPADSEVHLFGTTSANRGRFSGPVVGKIESLAADLKEGLAPRFSALKFERGDYGDHGLDIVGWAPWPDAARGMPISFAQCACTSEWISKQASSGFDRWSQVITFEVRPHNTCFIPFDFRSDDNDWYADHDIHSTILIDRRRFFQRTGFLDGDTPLPALTDAFIASLGVKAVMAGKLQDLQDI